MSDHNLKKRMRKKARERKRERERERAYSNGSLAVAGADVPSQGVMKSAMSQHGIPFLWVIWPSFQVQVCLLLEQPCHHSSKKLN